MALQKNLVPKFNLKIALFFICQKWIIYSRAL